MRRRLLLLKIAAVLILVVAATAVTLMIVLMIVWSAASPLSDRIGLVGNVLAASGVVLAVLAGLIGLAAYSVSTQRPDLVTTVQFRFSDPNEPVLVLDGPDALGSRAIIVDLAA